MGSLLACSQHCILLPAWATVIATRTCMPAYIHAQHPRPWVVDNMPMMQQHGDILLLCTT